jgi:hypothetical protein
MKSIGMGVLEVEQDTVIAAETRNPMDDLGNKVALRIDEAKPLAISHVLICHRVDEGGFALLGLSRDVHMARAVFGP